MAALLLCRQERLHTNNAAVDTDSYLMHICGLLCARGDACSKHDFVVDQLKAVRAVDGARWVAVFYGLIVDDPLDVAQRGVQRKLCGQVVLRFVGERAGVQHCQHHLHPASTTATTSDVLDVDTGIQRRNQAVDGAYS